MAKTGAKPASDIQLKRKVKRAQLRLEVAQARYLQAQERGEQEINQARMRAGRWMEKASQRVARRAANLAKLELEAPASSDSQTASRDGDSGNLRLGQVV